MNILVTGGAGYIGSHTCVELLLNNHDVIVVDDLSNSSLNVIEDIGKITGKKVKFYKNSLLDKSAVIKIFQDNKIDIVIHFAGFKAVAESVERPLMYYYNNIVGTLILCDVMKMFHVKNLIFSSSATVYGFAKSLPIKENFELKTTNPYGTTKLMIENILTDLYKSDQSWSISILRYFNPVGAHKSGLIGEKPNGIPNNLMPYISQVAIGNLEYLKIFGNDYDTHDGTGVRDYIHVVDLAKGHLKAIDKVSCNSGIYIYNLGTGKGYSVLDIVKTFEEVNDIKIRYKIVDRRPGDIAICYADSSKAAKELNWVAERELSDMCKDSWRFTKTLNKE